MSARMSPLWRLFHSLRRLAGFDRAVSYSLLSRALSTGGGLLTVPLVMTRLSAVEQGFYYTFASILTLQIFLELGFSVVAIQMVADEAAHLTIDLERGAAGPVEHVRRFSATIRFVRHWNAVVSIVVGVFLLSVGLIFFSTSAGGSEVTWTGPWVVMVFATAGGVYVRSLTAIVEGMGFVAESIQVNLWGGATAIVLTVAGLAAGLRLYSAPVAGAAALLVTFIVASRLLRAVTRTTGQVGEDIRIDWLRDVFPYQWRIALSWVSGWFIFSAMTPVVFRQLGSEAAGRFGLAMAISSFINTLALNWTSTKFARWTQLASRRDWKAMDSLFWKATPQAVGIAALVSICAVLFLSRLEEWIPRFAGRLPEGRVLLMLCAVTVMNQVVIGEAFYLRAHRKEPFLTNSVFVGAAMALGLFGFQHNSTFSISVMYAVVTLAGGLIWGSIVFSYCRSRWHSVGPQDTFAEPSKLGSRAG